MPGEGDAVARPSGRLDDRVLETLTERPIRIPFSGLRRTLGAHPEALTRALRRLEREGLVERSPSGYRSTRPPSSLPGPERTLRTVARIDLPPGVEPPAVLERLSGRWFGGLRWMGIVERPEQTLLAWARRDGTGTVLLGVRRGTARLYATGRAAGPDANDVDESAYELLVAVADALRPAHGRSAHAYFAAPEILGDRGSPGPYRGTGRPGDN